MFTSGRSDIEGEEVPHWQNPSDLPGTCVLWHRKGSGPSEGPGSKGLANTNQCHRCEAVSGPSIVLSEVHLTV